MKKIEYIDRVLKKVCVEKVYGDEALRFIYGKNFFGKFCRIIVSKSSLFSKLYGFLMKSGFSRGKIKPFIEKFNIDTSEFLDPVNSYRSFNDFFTRKLSAASRPIDPAYDTVIIPADGRYLFYNEITKFSVKGKSFDITKFIIAPELVKRYENGSMVIARLCPTDYHRYHFPCDCVPSQSKLINGYLYSVNPVAIQQNIAIFWENKRVITELDTNQFGKILFVEVGATSVGSIHQTYTPEKHYNKGDEKGYFSFGGSSLVLFFEKGAIEFSEELLEATNNSMEIKCLMGQVMGKQIRLPK